MKSKKLSNVDIQVVNLTYEVYYYHLLSSSHCILFVKLCCT